MLSDRSIAVSKDAQRERRLRFYCGNLYALATEILKRDLLTEDFHKPMMAEMDERRKLRAKGLFAKNELELWGRDYYKTTVRECQAIQDYLIDPLHTNTWWHAVEDKAIEAGQWIGNQFSKNDDLRALRPEIMPAKMNKRFVAAGSFRMPANVANGVHAPSFLAIGAGSEGTGGHSKAGYLDDIIGMNDIEDNLMPKKRRWFGLTVMNVVRTGGYLLAAGTRWDLNDIYSDWISSKRWAVRIRSCYETNGIPSPDGDPVLYTRAQIEAKRAGMSAYEFACQMQNDPLPDSARVWSSADCEHEMTEREMRSLKGTFFVLSDPAPAGVGSRDETGERIRGDGSKDEWAIAVVKKCIKKGIQVDVLVDGIGSRDLSKDAGFDEICRLSKKYSTPFIANEATGQSIALYRGDLFQASRRMGVSLWCEPGRSVAEPGIDLNLTYKGKNQYLESLATKARREEFFVCDTCPTEFSEGFLEQMRTWRPLTSGRTGLRFDDRANAVAFCVDPALQRFAPQSQTLVAEAYEPEEEEYAGADARSRYCGF